MLFRIFMYKAVDMMQGLEIACNSTAKGIRGAFNYVAQKSVSACVRADRKLERSPKVVSWPYRRVRYAYNAATGSTKALFIGGAVLGGVGLVGMGADGMFDFNETINLSPRASQKLWLAAKALDVVAIGKFFAYDLRKKKRGRNISEGDKARPPKIER